MDLLVIGEAVTANENGAALDMFERASPFNARGGRTVLAIYAPTADYNGTLTLQGDDAAAFGSPATVQAFTGTAVLIKKLTLSERYLRRNTASRTAGSASLYLVDV